MNNNLQELEAALEVANKAYSKKFSELPPGLDYQAFEAALEPEASNVYNLQHAIHLLAVPEMEPLDLENGDLMTLDQFVENVRDGGFIDYDGFGRYATETEESDITIMPSYVDRGIRNDFTHVMWYNR